MTVDTIQERPIACAWWGDGTMENSVLFYDRDQLDDFIAECDPAESETFVAFIDQGTYSRAEVVIVEVG